MSQIKWVWKQMKGFQKRYIVYLFLAMIPQVMMLLNPMITQEIVDGVLYKIPEYEGNMEPLIRKLVWLVSLMIGFTVLRTGIRYFSMIGIEDCGQKFLYGTKKKIYGKLQRQDRAFYKSHQTGDLMTRVTGDAEMGKHGIVHLLRGFLECIILYAVSAGYMFTQDVVLTASLMVFTPFIFIVTYRFAKAAHPYYVELREKLSKLNSNAQENIEGNRIVKAFTREEYEKEKFRKKNMDFRNANVEASFVWLRYYPAIEGFSQALPLMVLLLGGYFLMTGRITSGTFLAFNSLCWTMAAPMRTLGMLLNDTQRFYASIDKVIELFEAEPSIKNKDGELISKDRLEGKIEFRDVSVKLEHSDILEHVNLTINPGETVAIMGSTGSGKTTLINCISRFIDVTGGALLLDGIDVKDYDLDTLRRNIGVANQDVFLFSDSIDHNIAFGNSKMRRREIERFARKAKADFIWNMDSGFETLIGERGTGLSGGQKQRLALARALAVKPPILILDDTTSAVDTETETSIQNNLENLDYTCTKIIIAQRVFSARTADKIVILDKGQIVECGTQEELLRKNGYYAEIYLLQKGYSSMEEALRAEGKEM
ncbi:MAG: ABC transporter ATP-binding protein [Clostridiales bacterium]|nr:ABC transporter ATP-binding protein [Clostridiales bacterium]